MSADAPPLSRLVARDALQLVLAVTLVGLVLFAVTGVWPPMVAVESGSMEPHLERGDLVVVTDEDRYAGPSADDHGIVTASASDGYQRVGAEGDVIVYAPPTRDGSPIIHRAVFYVDAGENWYDEANSAYVRGANSCAELRNCPAPHAGYITQGDNNGYYDQASSIAPPVRPEWIKAKAQFHVPYLGTVRLELQDAL
ncbi:MULTISPECIES: S26 family signal peptidase [Haloferax]|uniref:S26 family signal peptidase n=2 Tax=Haloferax TaxID=2251 RepID=A0A6G1Z1V9_9EURY|nr:MULTISPECIES: S26 family signal peptidase [Haloferax]KAB1187949.1 S26 family signal peptidase [Haloferax sp. CBA1149]MRW80617.1 S26 family signal peptidase [Haloferax marinisediminis]